MDATTIERWHAVTAPLADPAVELDCECFAEIMAAFIELRRSGAAIDAGLLAIMTALARQIRDSDADGDSDRDVTDGLESGEDPDADLIAAARDAA